MCGDRETRTLKSLHSYAPEAYAYTNSAISPLFLSIGALRIVTLRVISRRLKLSLHKPSPCHQYSVGALGIEPSLHEPESCVLPVYYAPLNFSQNNFIKYRYIYPVVIRRLADLLRGHNLVLNNFFRHFFKNLNHLLIFS